MSFETAHRLLRESVARVFAQCDADVRRALVEEHTAMLVEPGAPSWHIARIRDRELLLVHDGARAWVAAWGAIDNEARGLGWAMPVSISRAVVGGPPGGYIASGVASDDAIERAWFEREGFVTRGTHADLAVTLHAPLAAPSERARRARGDEAVAVAAWVAKQFAVAWGREVARSMRASEAVFVCERDGAYVGFAAHSGHNAAVGTFGPVGVIDGARRGGLGGELTRAALDDLHLRGFRSATIPWVDPGRVAFYRAHVADVRVDERVMLAKQ